MPPKRGKRPAAAAPVTLGSDSDQAEVLQWLRGTVRLPGDMVDKVRGAAVSPPLKTLLSGRAFKARAFVGRRGSQAIHCDPRAASRRGATQGCMPC